MMKSPGMTDNFIPGGMFVLTVTFDAVGLLNNLIYRLFTTSDI